MPRERAKVTLQLGRGLDKAGDPFALTVDPVELENARFTRRGSLQRRPGFDALGTGIVNPENWPVQSSALAAAREISSFRDGLMVSDGWHLLPHLAGPDRFDTTLSGLRFTRHVASTQGQALGGGGRSFRTGYDAVENDLYRLAAYGDPERDTFVVEVVEKDTNRVVFLDTLANDPDGANIYPRCIRLGDYLCVLYHKQVANELWLYKFDTNALDVVDNSAVVTNANGTTRRFDVQPTSDVNKALLIYRSTAALTLAFGYLNVDGTFTPTQTQAIANELSGGVAIAHDRVAGRVGIAWSESTAPLVRARIFDSALTAVTAATTLSTTSANGITCAFANTDRLVVMFDVISTALVYRGTHSAGAGAAGASVAWRGAVLHSHCLVAVGSSTEDKVLVWIRLRGTSGQSRAVLGEARRQEGFSRVVAQLPEDYVETEVSSGVDYNLVSFRLIRGLEGADLEDELEVGALFARQGEVVGKDVRLEDVRVSWFDQVGPPVAIDYTTYYPGPAVKYYDGEKLVELGFATHPGTVAGVSSAAGGSLTPGNVFTYKLYYERRTRWGAVERSAVATTAPITVGGGHNVITLTIPTLRVTDKDDVVVRVYRNQNGGSTFFLVSDTSPNTTAALNRFVLNDLGAVDSVSFVDGMTDATLATRPLLDAELDPSPPPPSNALLACQRRLFTAGQGLREHRVSYSKLLLDDADLAEFHESLYVDVDGSTGRITGLGVLNNVPIVLTERAIYRLVGIGLDNAGNGVSYEAERVSSEVGCVTPTSVASTAEGVYFQSERGIELLDQGYNVVRVGEKLGPDLPAVTAAVVVPDAQEVRFLTEDRCYVLDRGVGQWSTWSIAGTAAALCAGRYVYGTAEGLLRQEGGGFTDAGAWFGRRVRLGWVKLDGALGDARLRRLAVVGRYRTPEHLRVTPRFDYLERDVEDGLEYVQDEEMENDVPPVGPGGDTLDGNYREGFVWTGDFARQEAASVQFLIEDVPQEPYGPGADLFALELEVALAGGTRRLSANRSK